MIFVRFLSWLLTHSIILEVLMCRCTSTGQSMMVRHRSLFTSSLEEGGRHRGSLLGRLTIGGIENSTDLSCDETFELFAGNIALRTFLKRN